MKKDKADRLVFSQDGEQRIRNEWSFKIYDVLDRNVISGTCNNEFNYPSQLENAIVGIRCDTENAYKGYIIEGVELVGIKELIVNYYDDYNFIENIVPAENQDYFNFDAIEGFHEQAPHSTGFLTGTITDLLDESYNDTKLITVMYYDDRGRMIQKNTGNILEGVDKEYICYTFTGLTAFTKHIHIAKEQKSLVELQTFTYDHAERLIKAEHQLRVDSVNNEKVTLAEYTYDELGRLITKNLHGRIYPISYSYNVRNWLNGINSEKFYQNIYYNTGLGKSFYNGNISSMIWKADEYIRGYRFNYDNLNRLTEAIYGEGELMNELSGWFKENVGQYDKHGNILSINRNWEYRSKKLYVRPAIIDDLSIVYNGNQLHSVRDFGTSKLNLPLPSPSVFHFVENRSGSSATQYQYDANGNLIKDIHKNINNIEYNTLNLPKKVQIPGGSATYVYDALGVKHKVYHRNNLRVNNTNYYCDNVIYENGRLSYILTSEGYITLSGTTPVYHYYLKDHLGSNRVIIDQNGEVKQTTHYYPFGGIFEQTAELTQPYKYNGKEIDRTFDLNWYDYSARYMDPLLGRFTTMDPMAEKYYSISPYAYCSNNPMKFVDPSGMVYTDYEIDINGYIRRIGDIDDKPDRLYGTNQSTGERESITVNDKEILKTLSGESNIQERDAHKGAKIVGQRKNGIFTKETITPMVNGHVAETNSNADAGSIFVFA